MTGDEMERTMQFILEQQAQFMANMQMLQEARARDDERHARDDERRERDAERYTREAERRARLERAFVQLTELAVSANERMNQHDARLASVEEAIVMLTRLVGGTSSDSK